MNLTERMLKVASAGHGVNLTHIWFRKTSSSLLALTALFAIRLTVSCHWKSLYPQSIAFQKGMTTPSSKAKVQVGDGNSTMVNNVTVFEMRTAMDPYGDYGTIKSTAKELDEFIDMIYQPCMSAIYGSNVGNSPSTDVKYLMAYPWHSHQECSHLSCFASGMRWNRDAADGGCVPGVLAGVNAAAYGRDQSSNWGLGM